MADADKYPTQAVPADHGAGDKKPDPSPTGRGHGGESGGGAYPNPHTGKDEEARKEGFGTHGGQTEIGYHGSGQLGDQKVTPEGNANSGARKG